MVHEPCRGPGADGKRLALAAVIAFCGLNGRRLRLAND
jgi:prophage maintenance system killer protein